MTLTTQCKQYKNKNKNKNKTYTHTTYTYTYTYTHPTHLPPTPPPRQPLHIALILHPQSQGGPQITRKSF